MLQTDYRHPIDIPIWPPPHQGYCSNFEGCALIGVVNDAFARGGLRQFLCKKRSAV